MAEYFIPADLGISQAAEAMNVSLSAELQPEGILYRPRLLAQAQVRYLAARYNFEYQQSVAALIAELAGSLMTWENFTWKSYHPAYMQNQPLPAARYASLPAWLTDARRANTLQKDFLDWVYRTGTMHLRANLTLKVFVGPQASTAKFREMCSQAAQTSFLAEVAKINATYDQKKTILRQKITHLEGQEKQQKDEVDHRKAEELGAGGEFILGLFTRRKRSLSTSLTKRRLADQAKGDLDQVRQDLATLQDQLQSLELVQQNVTHEAHTRLAKAADDASEVPLVPQKKDIFLELFGVAWMPFYLLKVAAEVQEVAAFSRESIT